MNHHSYISGQSRKGYHTCTFRFTTVICCTNSPSHELYYSSCADVWLIDFIDIFKTRCSEVDNRAVICYNVEELQHIYWSQHDDNGKDGEDKDGYEYDEAEFYGFSDDYYTRGFAAGVQASKSNLLLFITMQKHVNPLDPHTVRFWIVL